MRPPICDVCGEVVSAPGGLVRFAGRASDLEWRERAEREHWVGHPPDTAWLCAVHAPQGRNLAATTHIDTALQRIRESGVPGARDGTESPTGADSGVELAVVVEKLVSALPVIAVSAGLGDTQVTVDTVRNWTPMDRMEPPNCPYVDTTTHLVEGTDASVRLDWERAQWNPDELARTSVSLWVVTNDGITWGVSAHPPHGTATVRAADVRLTGSPHESALRVLKGFGLDPTQ